jgi:YNFM family putative membrane transporter
MLVCCVALTVFSALAVIAPTLVLLVAIRAAQGLVIPGITVSGLAYLHNDLPASWRGRVSGFYIGTNTLGGLVGRLGVGLLVDTITWRGGLAMIAGVVALGTVLLAFGMPKPTPQERAGAENRTAEPPASLRDIVRRLWWAPLIGGAVFFPFLTVFTYTPYRLEGPPFSLNASVANLFFLVYVLGAIASLVAGQVSDRIGRRSTIYLGLAICGVGLLLSLISVLGMALLALAFVCVGGLMSHVVANASVSDGANQLGPGARATALSLYTMGFYIGGGLGAFIPGYGWERWGWPGVLAPCAIALALASLCALKTPIRLRRQPDYTIEPAPAP